MTAGWACVGACAEVSSHISRQEAASKGPGFLLSMQPSWENSRGHGRPPTREHKRPPAREHGPNGAKPSHWNPYPKMAFSTTTLWTTPSITPEVWKMLKPHPNCSSYTLLLLAFRILPGHTPALYLCAFYSSRGLPDGITEVTQLRGVSVPLWPALHLFGYTACFLPAPYFLALHYIQNELSVESCPSYLVISSVGQRTPSLIPFPVLIIGTVHNCGHSAPSGVIVCLSTWV